MSLEKAQRAPCPFHCATANTAHALIWDLQPPELWFVGTPFGSAAQADEGRGPWPCGS